MANIIKATFDVTSPTVQYGNVHTILEVEGTDWEDIRDTGLSKIAETDAMVSPTPFVLRKPPTKIKAEVPILSRLTGVTLNYNPEKHIYTGLDGKSYLSGSRFPDMFYDPFDKNAVVERIQKAYPDAKVDANKLLSMWDMNNKVSTSFGNAVHSAMENYIKNNKLGESIMKEKDSRNGALSKNVLFSKIVNDFVTKFGIDNLITEEFVADNNGHCGRVDLIKIIDNDKKIIRIQDYKTDANIMDKKYQKKDSPFKTTIKDNTLITYHRFQLSFYAYILSQYGYTVEGLDIYWLNPETIEWEKYSSDSIDLSKVLGDKQ